MATTVRVDDKVHSKLRMLSEAEQRPIGQVIEEAVEQYQRQKFWAGVQEDFARLRADPKASEEYDTDLGLWDSTTSDGMEGDVQDSPPEVK
jgi:hypothetical protein